MTVVLIQRRNLETDTQTGRMPYDNEDLDDAAEAKEQQPCQQNTRS